MMCTGTDNYAQLREPADKICSGVPWPFVAGMAPRTATLEETTHHKTGSQGSQCVACHTCRRFRQPWGR